MTAAAVAPHCSAAYSMRGRGVGTRQVVQPTLQMQVHDSSSVIIMASRDTLVPSSTCTGSIRCTQRSMCNYQNQHSTLYWSFLHAAFLWQLPRLCCCLTCVPAGMPAFPCHLQTVTVKWRGKPVFIRHRTPEEIAEAEKEDITGFRDPETDAARVVDPKVSGSSSGSSSNSSSLCSA